MKERRLLLVLLLLVVVVVVLVLVLLWLEEVLHRFEDTLLSFTPRPLLNIAMGTRLYKKSFR